MLGTWIVVAFTYAFSFSCGLLLIYAINHLDPKELPPSGEVKTPQEFKLAS